MYMRVIELSDTQFEDMLEALRRDYRHQMAKADIPEEGNGFLLNGLFARKDISLLQILKPKHTDMAYEAARFPNTPLPFTLVPAEKVIASAVLE